jgi:hypothetical protein
MLTARNFVRYAFRCGNYEGEDVLAEVDDVDLAHLRPTKSSSQRKEIHKKIVWHDFTGKAVLLNMAFRPTTLSREYDLFVAYLPLMQDVTHLPAIRGWKTRCRTSILWIDEIWAADVPRLRPWLPALESFDHVVIGYMGTVEALSKALGRPCHFVPMAVDTIRFTPFLHPSKRSVDILSVGRRQGDMHQAFLDLAAKEDLFYVYDTFNASYMEVHDPRQHREMFASMARHSRYFVVAPAKTGVAEETRNQIEVGLRYYEASAAGAILIGQAPDCELFRTMFDWPDAVIELKPDGSDVADVLLCLASQPHRLSEISRRNAAHALLRHDWVYRWEKILEIAGLEPTPRLLARKKQLQRLAEVADADTAHAISSTTI